MKKSFLLAAALFIACPGRGGAVQAASAFDAAVQQRCYLKALVIGSKDGFVSALVPKGQDPAGFLDKKVSSRLKRDSLDYLEIQYLKGYEAWRGGDIVSARNHWFRYGEMRRRLFPRGASPQAREVDGFLSLVSALLKEGVELETFEEGPASPITKKKTIKKAGKPGKNKSRKPRRRAKRHVRHPISVKDLVSKGHLARERGQLELAARFYSLALKVDPQSDPARRGFDAVQKEMQ